MQTLPVWPQSNHKHISVPGPAPCLVTVVALLTLFPRLSVAAMLTPGDTHGARLPQ